ncbi:MAG: hypothetical protein ROZ09_05490 [Thiobacillus sp.]|jgi:hypothetical protein|uniref:hypothetical protein n=1 Tax=Thiobacillus sp. TaxID=924 RepID=UPI0028956867|nr:hypothetical protein [Thiobacillus sp.]MDT3706259.1 hypothetical protein [Thiobacillus sp.]
MKTSQFLPIVLLATAAAFSVQMPRKKPATAQASTPTADMTDGEIRKINQRHPRNHHQTW